MREASPGSPRDSKVRRTHLRRLLEYASDAVFIIDWDGKLLQHSERARLWLGYDDAEMRSLSVFDWDAEITAAEWEVVRSGLSTDPIYLERRHRRKDGSLYDAGITAVAFVEDGARLIYAATRDISAQKRAEAKLQDLEQRYRQFFEANEAVKLLIDPDDGRIREANPAAASYYGYPLDTLQGMDLGEINTLSTEPLSAALQAAKTAGRRHFEFQHRLASGEVRDVEVYTTPIDVDGRGMLYSIVFDVTEKKRQTRALNAERQRLAAIVAGTNAGTWEWNVQTGEARFNERWAEIIGYRLAELGPCSIDTWLAHAHPEDLEESARRLEAHFAGKTDRYQFVCRIRHRDGHWVWVEDSGQVLTRTPEGTPEWMYGSHLDVTHIKRAEEALREANDHLNAVLSAVDAAIGWMSEDGTFQFLNPQFTEMYGYTLQDVRTWDGWLAAAHPDPDYRETVKLAWREMETATQQGSRVSAGLEVEVTCNDGKTKWSLLHASRAGDSLVITLSDITEQKRREVRATALARHDPLTGLPNRVLLAERLKANMAQALRRGEVLCVAFLDLDGFKAINDASGHSAGDEALRLIAKQLLEAVRVHDMVARFGGDEFCLVFTDLPTCAAADPLLQRVLQAVRLELEGKNGPLALSASLGATFFPQRQAVEADQLIRQADQAMYQAKKAGKNRIVLCEEGD